MANVRIFCRFSPRPRPEETETIQFQDRSGREWCEKNGHKVVSVYHEPDCSGRDDKPKDRPQLWRVLEEIKPGEILLAWRWDRLSRSVYLTKYLERDAISRGYQIATVAGGIDDISPEGKLARAVLSAADEYTAEANAARTSLYMIRYQRENRAMSAVPQIGKRRGEDGQMIRRGEVVTQRRWEDDPEEAKVIDRVLAMAASGMSHYAIAKALNVAGVPSRGRQWYKETVKKIIDRSMLEGHPVFEQKQQAS